MKNTNRLYLDVVKGITIFLMLWTHCIQYCALGSFDFFENLVFKTVYSFHMPLFMMVSGYLFSFSFQKRELKPLLIHRCQSMLQPIVFGTAIHNLLINLVHRLLSGSGQFVDGELLTGVTEQLWFLWCVLGSSVVVALACKASRKLWIRLCLLLVGIAVLALFPVMDYQLFMYPFFVAGFLFAQHREAVLKKIGKLRYASLVIFPAMVPFYHSRHYIYLTPFLSENCGTMELVRINAFRILIGMAGSVFVLVLTELLLKLLERYLPWLVKALAKLGENSLQIYILSVPLLSGYLPVVYEKAMQVFGRNVLAENMLLYNFLFTPLLTAAVGAGLYVGILLLRKWKLHSLIFGR